MRGTTSSCTHDEPQPQSTALHEMLPEKLGQPSGVAVFIERKEFRLLPQYSVPGW